MSKNINEPLVDLVSNFAQPPEGTMGWWGHDTDLGDCKQQFEQAKQAILTDLLELFPECPLSKRVDGKLHSWKFDGDDPYVLCNYCGEIRSSDGIVIKPGLETVITRQEVEAAIKNYIQGA